MYLGNNYIGIHLVGKNIILSWSPPQGCADAMDVNDVISIAP